MDDFLSELGARLRSRRQQLRISQSVVARSADRSKQLVSAWERGRAEITASALAKVSRALNIDPGWLLFGNTRKRPECSPSNSCDQSAEVHEQASTAACDQSREMIELRRENQRLQFAVCELVLRKMPMN